MMQLFYLLLLLAALIVFNWRYLGLDKLVRRGRRMALSRECRWRKDPRRKGGDGERWVCARCGVDAYTSDGRPPDGCKRHLRDSGV